MSPICNQSITFLFVYTSFIVCSDIYYPNCSLYIKIPILRFHAHQKAVYMDHVLST